MTTMTVRRLSFHNSEIAQGYARILKHPLQICVDYLPHNGIVLSYNYKDSERYIKNFYELIPPGSLIHLIEIHHERAAEG